MNIFKVVFLDVILLMFPILIYYIYLSTNININNKIKQVYFRLALFSSFFILYNLGAKDLKIISMLILNSIIILSFLEDEYVLGNIFPFMILLFYFNTFDRTYLLLFIPVAINIVYLFKEKIKDILFIQIYILVSSIIYFAWIYKFNNTYFDIKSILFTLTSYFFIVNIMYLIYITGKKALNTHMTFKELQKEKQIRLSLFKITHEIKNPIAVCKGYLDMLDVRNQQQVEKYIPIIKSENERLLSLLQDFLLINKSNLDLDIMDFNMLIEDTVEKLNPLLNENHIKLNLDMIDDEIYINGDYNRLSQVLINLIKNSVEALALTKNASITISTKIKKNKYVLTLEDNGEGMSEETLQKMKEPFFTTKYRGSGLGVSLVYEIVEAHSGKVEYTSDYEKGTKVTIQIPLYEQN